MIDILIVEDETAHIEAIQRTLSAGDQQFVVRIAPDLRSCRKAVALRAPDIMLLDLNLPDGNSLELLKDLGATSPYPILVMTACGSEALAVEALKSGALDYVVKSSETFADMCRIIERSLRERRTREQHRQAVRALRVSEEKYRHLFQEFNGLLDAVPDSFMLVDSDLKILWSNNTAAARINKKPEELIGKYCHDFRDEPAAACEQDMIKKALETGRISNDITTTATGEVWDCRAIPLMDSTQKVIKVISMKRNITEQKRLQDEAARASRLAVLGQLSAGVAHEINNPNALILYNSELLTGFFTDLMPHIKEVEPRDSGRLFGGLPYREVLDEIPRMVSSIFDSAGRIKRIVNDLRDFSRQDFHDQKASVDLNQVARASARLVNNTLIRSTDHFILDLTEPLPCLVGVQGRLEQVVINLLINACQALEHRSQKIILATRCNQRRNQLMLTVTDEGQGMSAEILDHIFEPFVTTKRLTGGTGLGLSVSSRIVKEHNGTLSFTSAPGKGTSATLTLPIHPREHSNG